MNAIVTETSRPPAKLIDPPAPRSLPARINKSAAAFWLNYLFWHAEHAPWVVRTTKWFYLWFAWRWSTYLRENTLANARRLLGPDSTRAQRAKLAKQIIGNFYTFVYDVGKSLRRSRRELTARIESVEGHEHYLAARKLRKGAIVVTAHIGSFEAGIAALRDNEDQIHIVFQRDGKDRFERLRRALHEHLGVIEAPVDEGWTIWMRLRNALRADQVVIMQGDRVMPGQKGQRLPFFDGHMLMPSGPVKLAIASGAPIIPIFALRARRGKVRIFVEKPIYVQADAAPSGRPHPAMYELAAVLEKYVRAYPQQWLALHRAWCEDENSEH